MVRNIAFVFLHAFATLSMAQTQLSPHQIGGGNLPSNVADMVFTVADGNWVESVVLPKTGLPNARIKIIRNSLWGSSVIQNDASNLPVYSLYLPEGVAQTYTFSAAKNRWEFTSANVTVVNSNQPLQVPATQNLVSSVHLKDGGWMPMVVLPTTATNGALILVKSDATWGSQISPKNVLHERKMQLQYGSEYAFEFLSSTGKWAMLQSPQTVLSWESLKNGVMPIPTYPKTLLTVPSGSVNRTIRLPEYGSNRDHLIIMSNEPQANNISSYGVRSPGTMTIVKGQTYEFLWSTSTKNWERVKTAQTILKLNDLASDLLPSITTPVTEVIALEGVNAKTSATLPNLASNGDRVIFKSMAPGVIQVNGAAPSSVGSNSVDQNEEVSFVYNGSIWSRETYTVRMLLIHGTSASAKLGVNAMKIRLTEGLRTTNAALSSSGANLRLQAAGFIQHPENRNDAYETLISIRVHQAIQDERNRTQADAFYFEGDLPDGCGLGWVNYFPNQYNMGAAGNIGCGTGVMAHEFGHNMGLDHNDASLNTVMSPSHAHKSQYSNPKILTLPLGVALGFDATNPDEVSLINNNASAVSRFR